MWYIPTNMNYPKPFILKKYFFPTIGSFANE